MANLLFAALSLVSGFSKGDDNPDFKGLEIEKNNEFVITGTYAKYDNFYGINVTNTATEDYFYTFDLEDLKKIFKSGKEVRYDTIKEGDTLRITYDGSISLVYPPKLNNVSKIEIVENKK